MGKQAKDKGKQPGLPNVRTYVAGTAIKPSAYTSFQKSCCTLITTIVLDAVRRGSNRQTMAAAVTHAMESCYGRAWHCVIGPDLSTSVRFWEGRAFAATIPSVEEGPGTQVLVFQTAPPASSRPTRQGAGEPELDEGELTARPSYKKRIVKASLIPLKLQFSILHMLDAALDAAADPLEAITEVKRHLSKTEGGAWHVVFVSGNGNDFGYQIAWDQQGFLEARAREKRFLIWSHAQEQSLVHVVQRLAGQVGTALVIAVVPLLLWGIRARSTCLTCESSEGSSSCTSEELAESQSCHSFADFLFKVMCACLGIGVTCRIYNRNRLRNG
ncbi:unnamed protein product [Chrysoparadoxa australica]